MVGGVLLDAGHKVHHRLTPPVTDHPLGTLRARGDELDKAALEGDRERPDEPHVEVVEGHVVRRERRVQQKAAEPPLALAPSLDMRPDRAELPALAALTPRHLNKYYPRAILNPTLARRYR